MVKHSPVSLFHKTLLRRASPLCGAALNLPLQGTHPETQPGSDA